MACHVTPCHAMSSHVVPYHIGSHFKIYIPGIPVNFWQKKRGVLGRERSVRFDRRWGWGKMTPVSPSLLAQPLPLCEGRLLWRPCGLRRKVHWRHIHTQRTLMSWLPCVYWCMASSGTQVCWVLQKLKKTKGHWDKPRQGHFLGTNADLS